MAAAFIGPALTPSLARLPNRRQRQRQRRCGAFKLSAGTAASAPAHAVRRRVEAGSASELRQLAKEVEKRGDARGVLALQSVRKHSHAELLEFCVDDGPYELKWPSGPSWPWTQLPESVSSETENDGCASALVATAVAEPGLVDRVGAVLGVEAARGDLLAGAVLVRGDDVHVVCVHDPNDGAWFDSELAGADWDVTRYKAVHPPLSAWRRLNWVSDPDDKDENDEAHTVNVDSRRGTEQDLKAARSAQIASVADARPEEGVGELATARDTSPKTRLVFGNGAVDGVAIRLRDVSGLRGKEVLRVYCVCGWNEARMQPLNVETETLHEAGALNMVRGGNFNATDVTLERLRSTLEEYRITQAHAFVGFGGGAVIDATKTLAALATQSQAVVDDAFERIKEAAALGERELSIRLPRAPLPAVLVNGTIGSGASISELCLITVVKMAEYRKRRHSILIRWEYDGDVTRSVRERTALVDPRIVAPRRLPAMEAAQGGLLVLVSAVDVYLAATNSQPEKLALEAMQHGSDYILQALREPTHSDGAARDWLLRGSCAAALARDALGVPPVGLLLAIALNDAAVDGPDCGSFRELYLRCGVALIRAACRVPSLREKLASAAHVITGDVYGNGSALSLWLLRRGEDAGVRQARFIGVTLSRAEQAARQIAKSDAIRVSPHPHLETEDALLDMVRNVMDEQADEL